MQVIMRDMRVTASLGAYEWERDKPRTVQVSLIINYDGLLASETDRLQHALDYAELEQLVMNVAAIRHYDLIESLVLAIGQTIMAFDAVWRVSVEVTKPGALASAPAVTVRENYERHS